MEKILAAVSIPQLGDIRVNGEMVDDIGKGVIFQIDLKNKHYYLRAETFDLAELWVRHLLFTRDGLLNLDELRSALNNSTPPNKKAPRERKTTISTVGSIYNPTHNSIHLTNPNNSGSTFNTHNQDIEPSSYSSGSSNEYMDDLLDGSQLQRSRRQSDTTWQKAHRSFMSCCIRAC